MRFAIAAVLSFILGLSAPAAVVRPAPEFSFAGVGNRPRSLKSLRGQAVVLLMTDSAKRRAFRKQLRNLEEIYQQFASKQVIFIAAVTEGEGLIPSNMPVALASDPGAVTAAYGVTKGFGIAIIGRDGNLDYQTGEVVPSYRVRDVIQNSFDVQSGARKAH